MFKKIVLTFFIILILLIGTAVAIPYFFKDDIMAFTKQQLNNNLNATVNFADINLSLFKSFPDLHVGLHDLHITGKQAFEGITLAKIQSLNIGVNVQALWKNYQDNAQTVSIKHISLVNPYIHAKILKNGSANWDIMLPDTTQTTTTDTADNTNSPFRLQLQDYSIHNGHIIYDDASSNTYVKINGLSHKGQGDFTEKIFVLATNTNITELDLRYDGVNYLKKAVIDAQANIKMNTITGKYTLQNNVFALNALQLLLDGYVQLPNNSDAIVMDMRFDTKENTFKELLSLLPAAYTSDFATVKAKGKLMCNGFVKGRYTTTQTPTFGIRINVADGQFQYPDLPKAVEEVQLDLAINNATDKLDGMLIAINNLHFKLGKNPFDILARLRTPMSDPNFEVTAKGTINLSDVQQSYPLTGIKTLSGILTSDIQASGKMSAIDKEQYEKVAVSGLLNIADMKYAMEGYPPIHIYKLNSQFNPAYVTLKTFKAKLGQSMVEATGRFSKLFNYVLSDDGVLDGVFTVSTDLLNCDEWMSEASSADTTANDTSTTTPQQPESAVFKVPAYINFTLHANADKVLYDNVTLQKVRGTVQIKNETVRLVQVAANTLGGEVLMNGTYSTKNTIVPTVDIAYDLKNIDVIQAFNTFNSVATIAPVAKYIKGSFSSNLALAGQLDEQLMPQMMSFSGDGMAAMLKATLNNFEPLTQIGQALNIPKLSRIEVVDLKTNFAVERGRVMVKPFTIKVKDIAMNISGTHGFDQSLDYMVVADVPRKILGKQANSVIEGILKEATQKGLQVSLPDLVPVKIQLGGTVQKPTVKVDYKSVLLDKKDLLVDLSKEALNELKAEALGMANDIKEELNTQVKEGIEDVKEQAKKEMDEIKEEAVKEITTGGSQYVKDKVNDLKEEGTAGIGETVKDIGNKSKDDVTKAADSLKNSAADKAKDIFNGLWGKKKKK